MGVTETCPVPSWPLFPAGSPGAWYPQPLSPLWPTQPVRSGKAQGSRETASLPEVPLWEMLVEQRAGPQGCLLGSRAPNVLGPEGSLAPQAQ